MTGVDFFCLKHNKANRMTCLDCHNETVEALRLDNDHLSFSYGRKLESFEDKLSKLNKENDSLRNEVEYWKREALGEFSESKDFVREMGRLGDENSLLKRKIMELKSE